MYKVKIETFNGTVSTIDLPSKGAVAQFISTYPEKLPAGIAVKMLEALFQELQLLEFKVVSLS